MCLITCQKHPITNNKSIKAYKVIAIAPYNNFFLGVIMGFVKYRAPFYRGFDYTRFIHFHFTVSGPIPKATSNTVNQGFHLYLDLESAKNIKKHYDLYNCWVIFECEIPIGSKYFVSYDNTEICTNRFKFKKKLKI